jgi:hypothetical protein
MDPSQVSIYAPRQKPVVLRLDQLDIVTGESL